MGLEQIGYGYRPRASYACDPAFSKGRLIEEKESATRTPYQRDRDRIIHSTAFRRLKHKTQVFIANEDDHYRTRLTHTIEVAQIARAIARALRLDEDLAEAIALVHDFGHTPFGHTGEDTLNELMADFGGFDHNAQSLRIVTMLEQRYALFDGLNLSWETLEGLVKHNGPLVDGQGVGIGGSVSPYILEFDAKYRLQLSSFASGEAQAAAIADDIAYNTHDIDDGLRAGMFDLEQLRGEVPFVSNILDEVDEAFPKLGEVRRAHEFMRRQITQMVEDVIVFSGDNLALTRPQSVSDIRNCKHTMIGFSPAMVKTDKLLKTFLFATMYRQKDVLKVRERADEILRALFHKYFNDPAALPDDWREGIDALNLSAKARLVADFLAGMTDTYAMREFERLFDQPAAIG